MPKVFLTARQRREDAFRSAIKAYIYEEGGTKKGAGRESEHPHQNIIQALGGPGQHDAG